MKLNLQKKLAAQILKCSKNKICMDTTRLEDIKEAITKSDIRSLIAEGTVRKKQSNALSRARARKIAVQKRKGRRKGLGKRKGKKTARLRKKTGWINRIRTQRNFLKELKEKGIITSLVYHQLYMKSKGGFFRSKRHIKLYVEEHNLASKK
jgi:large subunit ribosomal protein L19e